MSAERIDVCPALTIMAHPGFAMFIWHDGPTVESVAGIERLLTRYESLDAKVDMVAIIRPVSDYPNDEARRRLAEAMRNPVLDKFAIVNAGKGFKASIVRSIISGITLLTRNSNPTKVFASLEDAGAWLHEDPRNYTLGDLQRAHDRVPLSSRAAT